MNTNEQIKNFALNVCCWQTENRGFFHKMSIHIQDVVPGFVITWIVVNNSELSFEGCDIDSDGRFVKNSMRNASELTVEEMDKILEILKGINMFNS